jgi:NAD(P)-dependent dehydrogenase (short-subunit alcohol dehydrogenase family)
VNERRSVLVTGGSKGIGLTIADAFAAAGHDVALCARDGASLQGAVTSLQTRYPALTIFGQVADIGDESNVNALFEEVARRFGGLDVLVANAGIYGPKGSIESVDWEEWCDAIRINLLGAVYCARTALPLLRRSDRGKVIILSGGGATKPLPNLSAYAASKAGLVRFGETLAEELRDVGIDVNMVAPGALNTRLLEEILEAGPEVVGDAFYAASLKQKETGGTPLELGAALCVFLGSRASDGITGKLISAPWDPWQRFEVEKERLDGDVYTLRRIVPEERGWSW